MRRGAATILVSLLALTAPLAVTGCSAAPGAQPAVSEKAAPTAAKSVEFRDGWASARDEMSGVFGEIVNSASQDLELVGATSDVADIVELHETDTSGAEPTMRALEGSLAVPAEKTTTLAPGGTHIMLMELVKPLLAGDEVPITLKFADGSTLDITVLVKDTAGAQENYSGDDEHGSHGSSGETSHPESGSEDPGDHAGH